MKNARAGQMFDLLRRFLALVVMAGLIVPSWVPSGALAGSVPENGQIAFKVLMDGNDIGRHTLRFEPRGETLGVEVKIDFLVTFLNIPVYRYNHLNRETWTKDGQLLALESQTNDDGIIESARVEKRGDKLVIDGSQNKMDAPAAWLSSSYWNPKLLKQSKLIDSRNGQIFNIDVEPKGEEMISVEGRMVTAARYDLVGDLQLSLWYDRKNEWVKLAFNHMGRHFDYLRVAPETLTAINP